MRGSGKARHWPLGSRTWPRHGLRPSRASHDPWSSLAGRDCPQRLTLPACSLVAFAVGTIWLVSFSRCSVTEASRCSVIFRGRLLPCTPPRDYSPWLSHSPIDLLARNARQSSVRTVALTGAAQCRARPSAVNGRVRGFTPDLARLGSDWHTPVSSHRNGGLFSSALLACFSILPRLLLCIIVALTHTATSTLVLHLTRRNRRCAVVVGEVGDCLGASRVEQQRQRQQDDKEWSVSSAQSQRSARDNVAKESMLTCRTNVYA